MKRLRTLAARMSAALGLCCAAWAAGAQPVAERAFETVVANYVADGLRGNLSLQGQHLEVEKASDLRSQTFPLVRIGRVGRGRFTTDGPERKCVANADGSACRRRLPHALGRNREGGWSLSDRAPPSR